MQAHLVQLLVAHLEVLNNEPAIIPSIRQFVLLTFHKCRIFQLALLHIAHDSPSDGVTEVFPLLGRVVLGDGPQLGVTHDVGHEDAQAAGDSAEHEVEVEIILTTNQRSVILTASQSEVTNINSKPIIW